MARATAAGGAVDYGVATNERQLRQILQLQRQNLEATLAASEVRADGFVTVRHDLDLLAAMNHPHPHVIAEAAGRVVGYALVMQSRFGQELPILAPMMERLSHQQWRGRPLEQVGFFIMGQVCVAPAFRGQGVFDGLYATLVTRYRADYELVVTEVAVRNGRSLRAHQRVGFQRLERYTDSSGESWELIALPMSGAQ